MRKGYWYVGVFDVPVRARKYAGLTVPPAVSGAVNNPAPDAGKSADSTVSDPVPDVLEVAGS